MNGFTILTSNKLIAGFDGVAKLVISGTYNINKGELLFFIRKNGSGIVTDYKSTQGSNQVYSKTLNIQVKTGDVIEFFLRGIAEGYGQNQDNQGEENEFEFYELDVSFQFSTVLSSITGGIYVDVASIMPETSQIDFVKDIMQQYGLIFQVDKNNVNHRFVTMESLLNDSESVHRAPEGVFMPMDMSIAIPSSG